MGNQWASCENFDNRGHKCSIKIIKAPKVGTSGDLAQEDSALPMHLHGAAIRQSFSKHEKNGKGLRRVTASQCFSPIFH